MPTNNDKRDAKWYGSKAKARVSKFFTEEVKDIQMFEYDVQDLYDQHFKDLPEFRDFPWDKTKYTGRFSRLYDAIKSKQHWADYDDACLKLDHAIYPVPTHNTRGEPVWYRSQADKDLRKDIADGVLKEPGFKPDNLRKKKYPQFSARRFNKRLDQIKQASLPFGQTPGQAKGHQVVGDETVGLLIGTTDPNEGVTEEPPCDVSASVFLRICLS